MPVDSIDTRTLKPRLTDGGEIALLDVREYGQYGEGHPFFAVNIPYSRLELEIERLVPRKSAPVVLMDDGDGVAERAARRLVGLGYDALALLRDGAQGWAEAGGTLFKGVNLPSKAFGELVEHAAGTPTLDARALRDRQTRGEPLLLLDGRTGEEFRKMSIPGAVHCPNAELGHRLPELLSDETTPVIINCAGRTRSIIGAQSLIAQGYKNPILALENGTQGWELAGLALDHGAEADYPRDLSPETLAASKARSEALASRYDVPHADLGALERWRSDDTRTLYVFDVRTPEEFLAGHLADARHAPGGQLVQATDRWVAVRGARIVLADDTGLRAANTAFWLSRMGHDAYILREDVTRCGGLVEGPEPPIEPARTLAEPSGGAPNLLDLNPSMTYRRGHISGAPWSIRPRLSQSALSSDAEIVLMAEDWRMAELAATDLRELGYQRLAHLPGGPEDWRQAGHSVVESPETPLDADCIDHLFFTHARHTGDLDAARAYLTWEIALPEALDDQERAAFDLAF